MILVAAIVVSIAVALLRGGRFTNLVSFPLRWGLLAVAAFAIQALFIYQTPTRKTIGVWGWQEIFFMTSHLLLLATVWLNRHLPGVKVIGLGLLLNLTVMAANGGWMPVTPDAVVKVGHTGLVPSLETGTRVYSSKNIILPAEQTKLRFLSDIFILARPFPIPTIFSIGDVFVAAGIFLLIQGAMLGYAGGTGAEKISRRE
ncbi:MAG: DUF5317 domain-containing protein [Anaerolineae bacterium]